MDRSSHRKGWKGRNHWKQLSVTQQKKIPKHQNSPSILYENTWVNPVYDTHKTIDKYIIEKNLWWHGGFGGTFANLKGRFHCSCKVTYAASLELFCILFEFNCLAGSLRIRPNFNCVKPWGSPAWKHIKVLAWNLIISTAGLITEGVMQIN